MGFWNDVCRLRAKGAIHRIWTRAHLKELSYKPNTIATVPSNLSIERDGPGIGDSVMKGSEPRAWRLGGGSFELIEDPDDDEETRQASRVCANERAHNLRNRGDQDQKDPDTLNAPPRPIRVCLTEAERRSIRELRSTEKKADWLVRKYLQDKYGSSASIEEDRGGADIKVSFEGKTETIEIKGTASAKIALAQLKVSSQRSHDALTTGKARMYRVVDVNSSTPRIYILEHGVHYWLEPELRWAAKSVSRRANEYPLRGARYSLERPFDAVAKGEWAVGK